MPQKIAGAHRMQRSTFQSHFWSKSDWAFTAAVLDQSPLEQICFGVLFLVSVWNKRQQVPAEILVWAGFGPVWDGLRLVWDGSGPVLIWF